MARLPDLRFSLLTLLLAATPAVHAQSTGKLSPLPLDAMQTLAAAYGLIRSDYVTPVDEKRLIAACTKGMFSALDSASAFLEAQALADLRGPRPADSASIGVDLTHRAGLPAIVSTHEDSPAERAGLKPRDYLLEIDGESLEETELDQAVARLRGKPGSELTLTIRRPGESTPRTLKLVREPVRPKPVTGQRWAGNLGYLRVRGLRENTAAELRAAFRELQQGGRLAGLVLDLRRSPGGLLETSIEVAAMFLPEQAVVTRTEGRLPEANHTYTADREEARRKSRASQEAWPEELTRLPLVVLVDGGTASGAEIIAAALRDNGRARLLGSKTFGRGSIQTLRQMSPNTAIKLTTAFYRTPGGQLLQNRGLQPDETLPELEQPELAGSDRDPALPKVRALLARG